MSRDFIVDVVHRIFGLPTAPDYIRRYVVDPNPHDFKLPGLWTQSTVPEEDGTVSFLDKGGGFIYLKPPELSEMAEYTLDRAFLHRASECGLSGSECDGDPWVWVLCYLPKETEEGEEENAESH